MMNLTQLSWLAQTASAGLVLKIATLFIAVRATDRPDQAEIMNSSSSAFCFFLLLLFVLRLRTPSLGVEVWEEEGSWRRILQTEG